MTIRIDQQGGNYYVYKNYKSKNDLYEYFCRENTGWRWSWSGDELTIYDLNKKEVGYLYFKRRIFRPSEFFFQIKINGTTIKIEPTIVRSWKDWIFEFYFENKQYRIQTHRFHYKSLFIDNMQVAAFNKEYFHFFDRETFVIDANDDINIILLICLATFDSVSGNSNSETINVNIGNITGSKPPEGGKWRPNMRFVKKD